MKVVVSKADIVALINKIQSLVSNKPAIPILSNVLIEAIDGQLILSATDLTTSIKCYTEAKIVEEGAIALPARKFFQLIKELTSMQIKLSTKNNIAEILSGSSVFKINGMSKDAYPTLPEFTGSAQLSLTTNTLKELLSRTAFSAAREDSRYILNGVLLKIENKKIIFIGTDGKRLAKSCANVDIDPSFIGSYVIPLKAIEEMIRSFDDNEERTLINLMADKIFFENGNSVLTTKLLSGQYPDVEKVIPDLNNTSVSLHREELIALLRQVSLFILDNNDSVRFIFTNGELALTANNSEIGEGNVSMAADYSKEKLEIAFNPHYFIDILKHSKDETVNLIVTDSYNPGVITDSTSSIFVIMPMKLPEKVETEKFDDTKDPALT